MSREERTERKRAGEEREFREGIKKAEIKRETEQRKERESRENLCLLIYNSEETKLIVQGVPL